MSQQEQFIPELEIMGAEQRQLVMLKLLQAVVVVTEYFRFDPYTKHDSS